MNLFKKAAALVTGFSLPTAMAFSLTSPDFKEQGSIPDVFTCHGEDRIPTLHWNGAPEGTKSFVLTVLDPDAPMGTWIHWVLYNIPSSVSQLSQDNVQGLGGLNSWNKTNYGGPCPPGGIHHYIFTLYALDTTLDLSPEPTLKTVMNAMNSHILGTAKLTGLYP